MEIQPNQRTGGVHPPMADRYAARRAVAVEDEVNFAGSAAVDKALRSSPEVRTTEVRRAMELVASPVYPPRETIRRLSELLAMNLPYE